MARKRVNGSEAGYIESSRDDSEQPVIGIDTEIDDSAGESGIPVIEPGAVATDSDEQPSKRGRGRPRGSRTGAAAAKPQKQAAADLTSLLMSTHMMLAAVIKTPELELDETEAKRLGAAVQRVNDEFGGFVISPKAAALWDMAMAATAVYGPRYIAIKTRLQDEAHKKPITINQVVN